MVHKHRRKSTADRFWSKVAGGDYTTCWRWTGAVNRRTGYGNFAVTQERWTTPHRYSYETMRGSIPAGLQIDHLCRVRICVNPWHMEPVTPRVNVRRSSNPAAKNAARVACVNGHAFSEENTYSRPGGGRLCRACRRHREATRRASQRSAKQVTA